MSARAGKRPLRSLTAHEKLDAIRRVHDGESKASVARDIGVPESTLRGWCKNEDKISYLSRQSSPETSDESVEQKEKRLKPDDSPMQPFNLSIKSNGSTTYSPNSETRYQADYAKSGTPLSAKLELPKTAHMSERDKNRAELARLSVELGLNRPEMFSTGTNNAASNISDITANINLLAQWKTLVMQQQQQQQKPQTPQQQPKVSAQADSSTNMVSSSGGGLLQTVLDSEKYKLPKDKQSVHDSVWYWLKSQQAMLNVAQIPTTPPTSNSCTVTPVTSAANSILTPLSGVMPDQSSWFWKWYKQFASGQQQAQVQTPDKPILYQQLTKDKDPHDAENLSMKEDVEKPVYKVQPNKNKARSVLDNILFNNNNNVTVNHKEDKEDEFVTLSEALDHGEKFLKWLEGCSDPSVTAVQIMQFKSLLNNVKIGAERKNGDQQNRPKLKRK